MGIFQESAILAGHVRYPFAWVHNCLNPFFRINIGHTTVVRTKEKEVKTGEYFWFNGIQTIPKTRLIEEHRRVVVWTVSKQPK